MAHVQHEGAAADRGAVHPGGRDPEIVGDAGGRFARGRDAVDIGRAKASVSHRVESGVGVELNLGELGDAAELGGLGGPDDGSGSGLHA